MSANAPSTRSLGERLAIYSLGIAVIVFLPFIFGGKVLRFVREALMQRVTSAHYEILCPAGALPQDAMTEFAKQRELQFTALKNKLGDADSNARISIIFDSNFPGPPTGENGRHSYSLSGKTIRTKLTGQTLQLPATADAEAFLYAAWGKPGSAQIASWTAIWLTGEWHGAEIGMAAAQVEQRLGHKKVEALLQNPGGEIVSPNDQDLLGAAWISEIAEFGGADEVRKLYAAKMPHPNIATVEKALGSTPLELDRKWQLWMYAYLAGMPSMPQDSGMRMNMPMAESH